LNDNQIGNTTLPNKKINQILPLGKLHFITNSQNKKILNQDHSRKNRLQRNGIDNVPEVKKTSGTKLPELLKIQIN
jgi:hypothetical protein